MQRHILIKALPVVTALAALVGLTIAAGAWGVPVTPEVPAVPEVPAGVRRAGEQVAPGVGLPVARVTIRPTGFDPAEVTLPRGRFLLAVDNRSGLNELTFRLDREGDGRLHEARMTRGRLAWRKVIDPAAGDYILTEATHPDWVCRVRISD